MGKAVRPGGTITLIAEDKGTLVGQPRWRLRVVLSNMLLPGRARAVDEPHDRLFRGHQRGRGRW